MLARLFAIILAVTVASVATPWRAGAQTPGYDRVIDFTFPVAGPVSYVDSYHVGRGGGTRVHQATDIMARRLQRVHAAMGGRVTYVTDVNRPSGNAGNMIIIAGDDGLSYQYIHLNNDSPNTDDGRGGAQWAYAPGMHAGLRVRRGQFLGYVGDSGNAEGTAPHLHFAVEDPRLADPRLALPRYAQDRLNPFGSLQAARRRGDVPADAPLPVGGLNRVSGSTRVLTAVALARSRASARTVVLVPAGSHVEALLATPLAAAVDAPILLNGPGALDPAVAEEVARLGARNAYLVGRGDQLSPGVADRLRALGVTAMARLEAPDPYSLSALIAGELEDVLVDRGAPAPARALLALGESTDPSRAWPDALSASALAAHTRTPILLTRADALPTPVRDLLAAQRPGLVQVVGGSAAIPDPVASAAASAARGSWRRLWGLTRYGTSVAVAQSAVAAGLTARTVWLATGLNYPDALAAGPAAAGAGAPLLLVDGARVGGSPESEQWLAAEAARLDGAVLVGGASAVSEQVSARLSLLLGG